MKGTVNSLPLWYRKICGGHKGYLTLIKEQRLGFSFMFCRCGKKGRGDASSYFPKVSHSPKRTRTPNPTHMGAITVTSLLDLYCYVGIISPCFALMGARFNCGEVFTVVLIMPTRVRQTPGITSRQPM